MFEEVVCLKETAFYHQSNCRLDLNLNQSLNTDHIDINRNIHAVHVEYSVQLQAQGSGHVTPFVDLWIDARKDLKFIPQTRRRHPSCSRSLTGSLDIGHPSPVCPAGKSFAMSFVSELQHV